MEPNELLKPRYKVIAAYPHSPWIVGEILFVDNKGELVGNSIGYVDYAYRIFENEISNFPSCFRMMEWWEERRPEDMPKYVKCIKDDFHPDCVPYYAKVDSFTNNGIIFEGSTNKERTAGYMRYKSFEPATKEEYEAYIKTKEAPCK